MKNLSAKHCEPCEGKNKAFSRTQAQAQVKKTPGWELDKTAKGISRSFVTKNFLAAVDFINKVAKVAEAEDHHPDIHLTGYRNLKIELSTHAIGGLSENDFILAAKINKLPIKLKSNNDKR